jgi:hypothetical protein
MVQAVVLGADLVVTRVCAESRLGVLLATSVRADVCVDVCGAHCVGAVLSRALIAQRGILLDDNRR